MSALFLAVLLAGASDAGSMTSPTFACPTDVPVLEWPTLQEKETEIRRAYPGMPPVLTGHGKCRPTLQSSVCAFGLHAFAYFTFSAGRLSRVWIVFGVPNREGKLPLATEHEALAVQHAVDARLGREGSIHTNGSDEQWQWKRSGVSAELVLSRGSKADLQLVLEP
jgi:hypothetical protein